MNMFNDMFLDEFNNNNLNTTSNMFNPYEGYMKGNSFKDYKPSKLITNSEQAELLLNLNQISFENQDIRLYLDIFPTDSKMINKYNENNKLIKKIMEDYEKKYGPLLCTSMSNLENFSWATYNFPWEEVNK